jgi:16S rRNA (cytosine967-C5)-methyltransferase
MAATSDHSDDLLHGRRLAGLSQADRNLATALVLGVLRGQIALDTRITPLLSRPDLELALPIRIALRLGLFQLLHMDRIPAHAALSESVELVRAAGHAHAAGMVNAILRKITRQPPAGKPLFETPATVAQRLGHPAWLIERWIANYGRPAAIAICDFDQQELTPGTLFPEAPGPHLDDGSRLVAELASAAIPQPRRIWDCCAAPGGKTLVLAARHPSAQILATDVSPSRLKALTHRLERDPSATNVRTLESDATALPASAGDFDLILCDVPCSGTGTLARNPEIRHHLRPSDLARQAERQRALLAAALSRLAPGGNLLYSTCSLEPEENEAVIAATPLPPGTHRLPLDPLLISLNLPTDLTATLREGFLRTLPGANFQGDGFFAALFIHSL